MAYNFTAERRGKHDLQVLQERLSAFHLIEFFPIEVSDESVMLGISIPFKAMDDPQFGGEFEQVMSYLVSEQGFQVTDLFTGNMIAADEMSQLARQISA